MTTVATRLATGRYEVAWALVLEGCDKVFLSRADAAVSALWSATDWTSFHYGLGKPGTLTRALDFLAFSTEAQTCTFAIVDHDRTLADFFAESLDGIAWTNLTTALDRDDTTIAVQSTSGFAASGTAYIGHEAFSYSGVTGTSFTGVTRGKWPHAGKAAWGHTFALQDGYGAEVTSQPRVWNGRGVTCYLLVKDSDGTWCSLANSRKWFVGSLDGPPSYSGEDLTWTLTCSSVEKRMGLRLLRDQFTAKAEGFSLTTAEVLQLDESAWDGTSYNNSTVTVTVPAGAYTADSLAQELGELVQTAAPNYSYDFTIDPVSLRCKVTMIVQAPRSATEHYQVTLQQVTTGDRTLKCLGLDPGGGFFLIGALATSTNPTTFTRVGSMAPVKAWLFAGSAGTFAVSGILGAWAPEPSDEVPHASATGFVYFEGGGPVLPGMPVTPWLLAVSYDGSGTFTRYCAVNLSGETIVSGAGERVIYYGDEDSEIQVKQVWLAGRPNSGTLARHLLRMLLSTGTDGYNDATDDKWPATMGLGIPSTVVDIDSIRALDSLYGDLAAAAFPLMEPRSAADVIQGILATVGHHLTWRSGKLTAVAPFAPASGATADWTIGDDQIVGHSSTDSAADLRKDALTLNYNRDPVTGDYMAHETYQHVAEQDAVEEPAAFEIEAEFLHDVASGPKIQAWRTLVAAPMLAYFRQGLRRVSLTGMPSLVGIAPGDVVDLTDDESPGSGGGYGV